MSRSSFLIVLASAGLAEMPLHSIDVLCDPLVLPVAEQWVRRMVREALALCPGDRRLVTCTYYLPGVWAIEEAQRLGVTTHAWDTDGVVQTVAPRGGPRRKDDRSWTKFGHGCSPDEAAIQMVIAHRNTPGATFLCLGEAGKVPALARFMLWEADHDPTVEGRVLPAWVRAEAEASLRPPLRLPRPGDHWRTKKGDVVFIRQRAGDKVTYLLHSGFGAPAEHETQLAITTTDWADWVIVSAAPKEDRHVRR